MINPQKTPYIAIAILVACFAILSCNRNKSITSVPPGKTDSTNPCYSCVVLKWDSLKELLKSNPKVMLEIYPVKFSSDMSVCRVDLATYLRGAEGKRIVRAEDLSDNKFKQASKNFAAFLKESKVPRDKVTMGYQLTITSATRAEKYVKVCYNAKTQRLDPPPQLFSYDSCRVPPGCAEMEMGQSNFIRNVIDEVYLSHKD